MSTASLSLTLPSVIIASGDGGDIETAGFTIATSRQSETPIVTVRSGGPGDYKVLVEELSPKSPSSDLQPLTDWIPFSVGSDGDALMLTPQIGPDEVPHPDFGPFPETFPLSPGHYQLRVEVADQSYRTRSDNVGCALLVAELSVVLAVLPMLAAWFITRSWAPITILAGWFAFAGAVHFVRDLRRSRQPPDPPHDYRIAIRPGGAPTHRPA